MDELTLLRRIRADVAEPSADVLAGARRRLIERVEPRAVPLRRHPSSWRRRIVVATATAAAVAAGLIALTTRSTHEGTPGGRAPALAPAAALLDRAAASALTAGDPKLAPGQYSYVRVRGWSVLAIGDNPNSMHSWLEETVNETWIPAEGSGTWYLRSTGPIDVRFFSAEGERFIRASHPDRSNHVQRSTFRPGTSGGSWSAPTAPWLAALPRDPDALLARIYADERRSPGMGPLLRGPLRVDGRPGDDDWAFRAIAEVMGTGLVPADLRAALYHAAAKIPGITVIDRALNLDGRVGVAVARVDDRDQTRRELIFDAAGKQLIGTRTVVVGPGPLEDVPVGTSVHWSAITMHVADKPDFDH